MNLPCAVVMLVIVPLLWSGCAVRQPDRDRLAGRLDVFGVALYSDIDYREIRGVVATEEPCLKGYERSFEPLDLTIGYGFDQRIRRIATFNATTSLFGIRPGMTGAAGREMALQAGFREDVPPDTFRADDIVLKLLVGSDERIFGLTLETVD